VIDEIAQINVRDGTSIGARIYRPDGAGLIRPARGCALPLDNNNLPASAQFLWRETGLDHRTVGRPSSLLGRADEIID
jgi:predicted acyl esterase